MDFRQPFRQNKATANEEKADLGFGEQLISESHRLINEDGTFNVQRKGKSRWFLYQNLVEMSWPRFFLVITTFYILVNCVFALLYLLVGIDNLSGVASTGLTSDFLEAFFFSTQTFTTVGYGAVSPTGWASNIIASSGALVGLMSAALATGLFFARFSKPKANLIFSTNALIAPYRDGHSFQFRIANLRDSQIIGLEAKVTMSWVAIENNMKRRHFAKLDLERSKIDMFPLNWTIVHPINQKSPLWNKTEATLQAMNVEFLILIEGYDETYAQKVHSTQSYSWSQIQWGERFERMYYPNKAGVTILNLDKINDTFEEEE